MKTTQECHGILAPMTNRDFLVRLVGKELIYNGPKDLKNYVLIGNISFDDTDEVIIYIQAVYIMN